MFTFKRVETEDELKEVFKLRYQVYCLECGFESTADHPSGTERDEYDEHSVHFIAKDRHDNIVGTVRLIKSSELGFPIEKHCKTRLDTSQVPKDSAVEVSRLAISKLYRRRAGDDLYGASGSTVDESSSAGHSQRRRPEIVLGLYKAMYRESKWLGVVNWYAVMEKSLFQLLKVSGVVFNQIGDVTEYHGNRIPYIARISNIERQIAQRKPELFHFFTDWERDSTYSI
ncbi:MAG: hypothetical protein A2V21_305210 [Deltaproteobacteria bacterium GWC2_55_46]|nr:MAG: hypothetical protein A2Z79_09075 [Deltaproteobacteria bacterium GWA2_55_82]OGQ64618.1 MAG: hypothetical protein A3I81_11340 [Deltaproteobacteria bacterium RIFCSPLOWO2_02_FULL_55_12]OIJ73716.1 MAG: hypothetical protein A2V21_305210 [Deltaproteobacteria bacterium GWC2_55_46]